MKYSLGMNIGAATGLAISLAAQAADLEKAPVYRPPPPAAPDWTSCYLGVKAGGGSARASTSDPIFGTSIGSGSHGRLGGGDQLGRVHQVGPVSNRFEGMADAGDIKGSGLQPNGFVMNNFSAAWIETVTARVGVLAHPVALLYLKGGGAWMQQNVTMTVAGVSVATGKSTISGWTAGGGIEFLFAPNWSAFVEYSYHGFGDNQAALTLPGGVIPLNFNLNVNSQTILVGVNFRFGDPLAPTY